jgi:hypothetical protein
VERSFGNSAQHNVRDCFRCNNALTEFGIDILKKSSIYFIIIHLCEGSNKRVCVCVCVCGCVCVCVCVGGALSRIYKFEVFKWKGFLRNLIWTNAITQH